MAAPDVIGSAKRGTILHKLMEEVLTGELSADAERLTARAAELLAQLDQDPAAADKGDIVPAELATTIVRTLHLPEIAQLRPRLLPEFRVYRSEISGNGETLTSGIADAVALGTDATIDAVIDWKSDVDLDAARLDRYRGQLATYRKATGATRALLVMMTTGRVIELT
jgi:exodeoxyribonuclease-5